MGLLWMAHAQAATPFFGLEWRPFSRSDLAWVVDGRTSGTAVGEFDGAVNPVLSAFGGVWVNQWVGVTFGVGLARLTSTSSVDDIYVQQHWGVVRPSFDMRFGWLPQTLHRPVPWFLLGMHGDIPSSREVSNGFTEEEQTAADASSEIERLRLGGFGGRAGFGVDYRLMPGLLLGAQVAAGLHRTSFQGGDGASVSIWVTTEASLLLTFEWPPEGFGKRRGRKADEASAPPGPG